MSLSQTMNPVTEVKLFQTVLNMEQFRNFWNFCNEGAHELEHFCFRNITGRDNSSSVAKIIIWTNFSVR